MGGAAAKARYSGPIASRLEAQGPLIEAIRSEAGVPGLAIGVIHGHRAVYESYVGLRDVEAKLPVDQDTLFYVASLTKAMTATALAVLVDQGRLGWDTPVHDILQGMSKDTELAAAKLNVVDILCHRTGKAWADALYLQSNNRILLPKEEAIRTFDYLPQVTPVRAKQMYNNHAYNLAGLVVEGLSDQPLGDFLTENIFAPIDMTRTFTEHPDGDGNIASPYNVLSSRVPSRLPFTNAGGSRLMFGGQSVRTSMTDMLKYSAAYLDCLRELQPTPGPGEGPLQSVDGSHNSSVLGRLWNALPNLHQAQPEGWAIGLATGSKPSPSWSSVSRQVGTIIAPHVRRDGATGSLLEQTYGLGWNRTQLPGSLDFGWNQSVLGRALPPLGQAYPGRLALWHGGNMPGTTAALCLLPETGTAVVVMQNSLGLCDVADLVCQLIIDTIFAAQPQQDYLGLTRECVAKGVLRMDAVERTLAAERVPATEARPLASYVGRYYNRIENWFMDIKIVKIDKEGDGAQNQDDEKQQEEQLCLEFLGRADERYLLRHYHFDSFVWNLSYDELVKRGQYIRAAEYYKLDFRGFEKETSDGKATELLWKHDKSVPQGEIFAKSLGSDSCADAI